MSMLFPWALLGLLALPALLALYLLRRRHRPVPVAAVFLWRAPHLRSGGGRRLSRLDHALLLLLELIIAALLALAATGPGCRGRRPVHRVAVVLDDSASMAARLPGGHPSPAAQAGDWLRKEMGKRRPFDCTVILSGQPPRLASAAIGHPRDLAAALAEWRPRQPAHDAVPALRLARQTVGEEGHVIFLTDHAPPEQAAPDGIHWRAFGTPVGNAGITSASRETDPVTAQETVVAEVTVFGESPHRILECRIGERILAQRELLTASSRDGRSEFREIFTFGEALDGPVRLVIAGNDGLGEDDTAILLPSRREPVRVQVAMATPDSSLARLLARTLEALGNATVTVPSRPHLIVTDMADGAAAMRAAAPHAWSLSFTAGDEDTRRHYGPYVIAGRHPLCRNLDLTGIRWLAPEHGVGNEGILPLVTGGGIAARGEALGDGRARDFRIAFQADGSNLQRSPAWPVLIHNLVRARADAFPGFRTRNLRAGQEATYHAAPDAQDGAEVSVRQIHDGNASTAIALGTRFRGGQWRFSSPTAGLFAIAFGQPQAEPEWLAFQFSCPEESDLRQAATGAWGELAAPVLATGRSWRDDAWIFILAALAVAAVHLVLATAGRPARS